MAEIKAIETIYNGYRFRSRLEARWAVFMDYVGIEYQYEPEGFDLGDGYYYLPDFYLPNTNAWVEIKGTNLTTEDHEKLIRFGEAKCDFVNGGDKFRLLQGEVPNHLVQYGSFVGIPCYNYLSADECRMKPYNIESKRGLLHEGLWMPSVDTEDIILGLLRARQARFEHGECGM